MHIVQKRTWEENDKFIFDISDEINGNLFLLEEVESVRRIPRDRQKLAEHVRVHARVPLVDILCRCTVSGAFLPFFSIAYIISPHYCHRFVGYLEEEAVITYTKCLQVSETGFNGIHLEYHRIVILGLRRRSSGWH